MFALGYETRVDQFLCYYCFKTYNIRKMRIVNRRHDGDKLVDAGNPICISCWCKPRSAISAKESS